jgi:hypothetical protein
MNSSFPLFCYTFDRSCPEPDTNIQIQDLIDSPPEITELENTLGKQLRKELIRLGGNKPLPKIRKSKKRPSIECKILNYK